MNGTTYSDLALSLTTATELKHAAAQCAVASRLMVDEYESALKQCLAGGMSRHRAKLILAPLHRAMLNACHARGLIKNLYERSKLKP